MSKVKNCLYFLKKDIVLSVSLILAIVSCMIVLPNREYLGYIDFKTLIMLFCLMLIVEGLREQNLFQYVGSHVLGKVKTEKGVAFTLVFLCFLGSMFITNDVALITFVPFGIMVLEMTGLTSKLCYTVVLMTIAGNLGSMFTPIGNPQNLYLYSLSKMSLYEFLKLMFPYTMVAAILLIILIFVGYKKTNLQVIEKKEEKIKLKSLFLYIVLFVLCLLTVAGIVPHVVLLVVVGISIFFKRKKLFLKIDYSLLLIFIFFFIFTGNMKHIQQLQELIVNLLANHERAVSILSSQVISNVPTAMLLSGYTDNVKELIVGTNLGGLGTLIASMASLISYKQIARFPELKKKYIAIFTVFNLIFLIVLWII